MITLIHNDYEAKINETGAQLTSFKNTVSGTEYIWCGDASIWGKSAPILFPFVGSLEDGYYIHDGKKYYSDRHGFFQKQVLKAEKTADNRAVFTLTENETTFTLYPFSFEFKVIFTLENGALTIDYEVKNTDTQTLYFAAGGHTALATEGGKGLKDCVLTFDKGKDYTCYRSNADGIFVDKPLKIFGGNKLNLSPELFDEDSFTINPVPFNSCVLSREGHKNVKFSFAGFKAFVLWAKKGTDRFICLEPWSDHHEAENAEKELSKKKNLTALPKGKIARFKQVIEII